MQRERELFEGIICKFLLNLPAEEREEPNRLSYHAEKAFYYFLDEVLSQKETKEWEKQRNEFFFKLKEYAGTALRIVPQQLAAKLMENKPVCGAIIFNRDASKVLVIRVRAKYGFPKGKWNQHESPEQCAAREVQEETGLYIHNRIDSRLRIDFDSHGGPSVFFVARGIGEDERLRRDQKEIDAILWMWVEDLRSNMSRFVERSRIAWAKYEQLAAQTPSPPALSIEQFLAHHRPTPTNPPIQADTNPLLSFKLDRGRLQAALLQGF